jgi:hypothetical protein
MAKSFLAGSFQLMSWTDSVTLTQVRDMESDFAKMLKAFESISEANEVRRVLEVVTGAGTYRVELLFNYSNANAPWNTHVYLRKGEAWERIPDFPWVMERTEESAIRSAFDFLEERARG